MTAATTPTPAPPGPVHDAPMQLRQGRTGPFYGCARYPECRETVSVGLPGIFCPRGQAPIVERIAKKSGRPFWPCANRACDFVAWRKPHRCVHGSACFGDEPQAELTAHPNAASRISARPDDDDVPF